LEECIKYARLRVEAAMRQLDETFEQQFPYPDAEIALRLIRAEWKNHLDTLTRTPPRRTDVCVAISFEAIRSIRYFLPFVGLVARCASVRHAFELYGPLRQMAKKLLRTPDDGTIQEPVRLILSSGWDYAPQSSRQIETLYEFVFIILPGCESANPLLIPLAGHELGHAVWERENVQFRLQDEYARKVKEFLIDKKEDFTDVKRDIEGDPASLQERIEKNPTYADACKLVRRQLEEIFCDFVGLYLFGESYLHAFAYFLSPDFPEPRSPKYPTVRSRVSLLTQACTRFAAEWGSGIYKALPDSVLPQLKMDFSAIWVST
jgi:hypothetical protein